VETGNVQLGGDNGRRRGDRHQELDAVRVRRAYCAYLTFPRGSPGFARHTAQTTELTSPIYAMIAAAGTGEDELEELQTGPLEMRFGGQRKIMIALVQGHSLRPGLTAEQAADTFSALVSPELHLLLTVKRVWSQRRYARWLEETVTAALLGDATEG
jgi:hypothetical protein